MSEVILKDDDTRVFVILEYVTQSIPTLHCLSAGSKIVCKRS